MADTKITHEMVFALRMLMVRFHLSTFDVLGILTELDKERGNGTVDFNRG